MSLIIVMLVTGIVVSCYLLLRATEVEQARNSCDHCGAQQVAWHPRLSMSELVFCVTSD